MLWETGDRGDTWGDTIPGVPHMRHCRAIGKISEVISQIRVVAPQRVGSDCHGTLFYLVMMMVMTTMMEILSLMMILMMVFCDADGGLLASLLSDEHFKICFKPTSLSP